jgi:hypothetical protein
MTTLDGVEPTQVLTGWSLIDQVACDEVARRDRAQRG